MDSLGKIALHIELYKIPLNPLCLWEFFSLSFYRQVRTFFNFSHLQSAIYYISKYVSLNLKAEGIDIYISKKGSSTSMCILSYFSHIQLFVTLWTVAYQASLPMGFSRQEYWSGLPSSPPGDLPHPGSTSKSLTAPALAGWFFTISVSCEAPVLAYHSSN